MAALAGPALAQEGWTINRTAGAAVMDEASSLFFTVGNNASSRVPIDEFTLQFHTANYDVEGASAPPGWRVSSVDRINRRASFRAATPCTATSGLRPGQSDVFEVRVIGRASSQDVTSHSIQQSGTRVVDRCNTGRSFSRPTGDQGWRLHSLASAVTVSPRALNVGADVAVTLTITNRSSQSQTGIAPLTPTVSGGAAFTLVSGPVPAQAPPLAVDAVASFTWLFRATSGGVSAFSASARNANGTVTSPPATSLDVSVGTLPAVATLQPTVTTNGGEVELVVQVSNNTGASISAVTPDPLVITGSAGAVILEGPTPGMVSSLGAGATTGFKYRLRLTGEPGDRVTFLGQVRATSATGSTLASDPARSATATIEELTLTPSPASVLSGSGATSIGFTLRNGGPQAITSVVFLTPDTSLFRSPSAGTLPGWTTSSSNNPRGIRFSGGSIAPGAALTFPMQYASIGTVTQPTSTAHRAQVTYADGATSARVDTRVTVATTRVLPEVAAPVAIAKSGSVVLSWSNPAIHDGVLVLRSVGAPPNTAPTQGRRYSQGELIGNAVVAFTDAFSFLSTFTDTAVTPGQTLYYRLFNRDEYSVYSPGSTPAPAPSNHLLVVVPDTGSSAPAWCLSMGLPALQQPFTELGRNVYQSSNGRYFTGTSLSTNPMADGVERWRPSLTRGVVQARPTAQRVGGEANPSLFVGDQLGYAYRLSTTTGGIMWTGNGGAPLGEVIQAQAVVGQRQFSTPAFQAMYPVDLVFFATRNTANRASNSVRALRADTGALVWSYQPGDLDQVTGTPFYDAFNGMLWVASARQAGPSLRVLDVLNPTAPVLTVSDLGDIPSGVAPHGPLNQAVVVDRNGKARGYHLGTRQLVWEQDVGGTVTAPIVPWQSDFIVSTTTGVMRYRVDSATSTVSGVWSAPTPLRLPTAVRIDSTTLKLYVSDADGFLRRLDLATGALEASVAVSTVGGASMPSFDSTSGLRRVYVGTADGRLCAMPTGF
jgi:hypothetical protein